MSDEHPIPSETSDAGTPPRAQPELPVASPSARRAARTRLLVLLGLVGLMGSLSYDHVAGFTRTTMASHHASQVRHCVEKGSLDDALSEVNEALAWLPEDASLVYLRAQLHCRQQQWEPALADLNRLVDDLAPEFAGAYLNRSLLLFQMGEFEKAMVDADRAVALSPPGDGQLLKHRAYISALVGERLEQARNDLQMAFAIEPRAAESFDMLYTRALVRYRLQDLDGAHADVEAAIAALNKVRLGCRKPPLDGTENVARCHEQDHTLGEMHYLLGLIEEKRGRTEQAQAAYAVQCQLEYLPNW
jgi:tetratricopeptide (TPR) repeat protein